MAKLKNFCGVDIEVPDEVVSFIKEYEKLCSKYNLMVFSDGESVEVDKADDGFGGIRMGTANWWNYKKRMKRLAKDQE